MVTEIKTGLALLREKFPAHLISKKPNPTKNQTEELKQNRNIGINCPQCGTWHHKNAGHLDYVGHAALTDRLLDADPSWNWEPQARDEFGLPRFDQSGGLWINLTVCGVTRPGYGNAKANQFAEPGSREKEVIGDALRNAAMRFGCALDLWSKADLHADEEVEKPAAPEQTNQQEQQSAPQQNTQTAPSQREDKRPEYPQDRFKAKQKSWYTGIMSGEKTAKGIIDTVSSTYRMTSEQVMQLETWQDLAKEEVA